MSNTIRSGSAYKYASTGLAALYQQADGTHRFFTAASGTAGNAITFTQAMTLDTSGRLGIGVTPANTLDVNGQIRGRGVVLAYDGLQLQRDSSSLELLVAKYWNGSGAPLSAGNKGDIVAIGNAGGDGLVFVNSNTERARIDSSGNLSLATNGTSFQWTNSGNNVAINATSGVLSFYTGTSAYTERARITSGGDLQVGGTNGTYQVNITQSAGDMIRMFRDTSNTVEMFTSSSSTNIFYITVDNSQGVSLTSGNTSWGSYSDARLKNVTGTYADALADVSQLEAVKFTWKSDEAEKPHVGLLAQSVAGVIPEAVDTDEQGMMSVRYTEVIPLLVAAIQELNAKNASLEARLAALEN
jgi:hypothetical protein